MRYRIGAWRRDYLVRCLSYRVSYCVDTEISSPYPESWGEGVYEQTFPQGVEKNAGVRDS